MAGGAVMGCVERDRKIISAPSEWDHTSLNSEVQHYRNINRTRISGVHESSLDRGSL